MIHSFYSEVLTVSNGQIFKETEEEDGSGCTGMIQSERLEYVLNSYLFLIITKTKECKNNMFI